MKSTLAMALFGAALISFPASAQTQRPADHRLRRQRSGPLTQKRRRSIK